ncbi:MAG: DUF4760 domain-containing protein [Ruminococcaceae bacterium]|nr:DUF4760 domain-containing protein [Oscillospiraceae bacterium]
MEIISLLISVLAIIVAVAQHFSERNRSKKEATIHAFDQLEETVFSKEGYKKLAVYAGVENAISGKLEADKTEWSKATLLLSRIEHFAVGVNTGIYDLKTLNRMAGGFMIEEFERWKPIIETKRVKDPASKHYDEFEMLYNSLLKMRK